MSIHFTQLNSTRQGFSMVECVFGIDYMRAVKGGSEKD